MVPKPQKSEGAVLGLSSPAGVGAPLAIATAVELPLPIQHRLEVAALEAGHQPIVGASLVPGEKENPVNQRQ